MIEDNPTPTSFPSHEELQQIAATPEQCEKVVRFADDIIQNAMDGRAIGDWKPKLKVEDNGTVDVELKKPNRGGPADSYHIRRGGPGIDGGYSIESDLFGLSTVTEGNVRVRERLVVSREGMAGVADETPTILSLIDARPAGPTKPAQPSSASGWEHSLEGLVKVKDAPVQHAKHHWWQRNR